MRFNQVLILLTVMVVVRVGVVLLMSLKILLLEGPVNNLPLLLT